MFHTYIERFACPMRTLLLFAYRLFYRSGTIFGIINILFSCNFRLLLQIQERVLDLEILIIFLKVKFDNHRNASYSAYYSHILLCIYNSHNFQNIISVDKTFKKKTKKTPTKLSIHS